MRSCSSKRGSAGRRAPPRGCGSAASSGGRSYWGGHRVTTPAGPGVKTAQLQAACATHLGRAGVAHPRRRWRGMPARFAPSRDPNPSGPDDPYPAPRHPPDLSHRRRRRRPLRDRPGRQALPRCLRRAAVSCLGHSRRDVVEAIQAQLDRLPYAHTAFFTNQPSEDLAEHLTSRAPDGLEHIYFVSGGSEANETALKLARQAAVERGERQRTQVIARHQSYHGNTLGALGASGNPGRRQLYGPLLADNVHFIDPATPTASRRDGESAADYARRAADRLEAKLRELGPENVLAFIAEPVVGATLGAVPAVDGYLKRIREICDRHGVTLILDEVMCGMGRTGTLYACAQDGVTPDLLTCAKGLGAGYQPVGAVLMSRAIYDAIAGGSGAFQHGFTYIGHPTACAGALAVQRRSSATTCSPTWPGRAPAARRPGGPVRRPSARRRYPGPRAVPRPRAGRRPGDQDAVRSRPEAARPDQVGGVRARTDLLPERRHGRRRARRPRSAGPALHPGRRAPRGTAWKSCRPRSPTRWTR